MKTLEQILKETAKASKGGDFGIDACKESIKDTVFFRMRHKGETKECALFAILQVCLDRARKDSFFNPNMVQACWQLINER